ncbi:hypothetical protein, partial [Serratia entomophila]
IRTARWDIVRRGNLYAGNYRNRKRENASGYRGSNPTNKQRDYLYRALVHKPEKHNALIYSNLRFYLI